MVREFPKRQDSDSESSDNSSVNSSNRNLSLSQRLKNVQRETTAPSSNPRESSRVSHSESESGSEKQGSTNARLVEHEEDIFEGVQSETTDNTGENGNSSANSAGFSKATKLTIASGIEKITGKKETANSFLGVYEKYYEHKRTGLSSTFTIPRYEKLPILEYRKSILKALNEINTSQCIVIRGATGSGKTTQVPLYILDDAVRNKRPCTIWVTQPRKLAARTVSQRLIERSKLWRNTELPNIVGYHVGLDKCVSKDSRIIYMTPGIASRKMHSDRNLEEITHLIIATIEADQYIDYFKISDKAPEHLKIEGHTFNVEEKYLEDIENEVEEQSWGDFRPATTDVVFEFRKKKSSVLVFLPGLQEINQANEALMKQEKKNQGLYQVNYLIHRVHSTLETHKNNKCLRDLIRDPAERIRKIVLSTNICESSITIPDIKIVIDSCLTKINENDEETYWKKLEVQWASMENCDQRRGRAGRVSDGICYRLLPKKFYKNKLRNNIPPEIKRCNLESVILTGKIIFPSLTPREFLKDAIEAPNDTEVLKSVKSLKDIGALSLYKHENDEIEFEQKNENQGKKLFQDRISINPVILNQNDIEDGSITPIGKIIAALPIESTMSRMIYFGLNMGLADEAIVIAACSENGIWDEKLLHSRKPEDLVNQLKKMIYWSRRTSSDHIANLKAFQMWINKVPAGKDGKQFWRDSDYRQKQFVGIVRKETGENVWTLKQEEMDWCNRMGLQAFRLREAHELADDIHRRLVQLGYFAGEKGSRQIHDKCQEKSDFMRFSTKSDDQYVMKLKIMLAAGLYPDYFSLEQNDREHVELSEVMKNFNPLNTVYFCGLPQDGRAFRYAKGIKEKMQECGMVSRIYIKGEYAFVEFDRVGDLVDLCTLDNSRRGHDIRMLENSLHSTCQISPSVNCALKYGMNRINSDINYLDVKPSKDIKPKTEYDEYEDFDEHDEKCFYMICKKSYARATDFPRRKHSEQCYEIIVTEPVSLTVFYAIRDTKIERRDKIDSIIEDWRSNNRLQKITCSTPPSIGDLVIGCYIDGECRTYHRAVVLQNCIYETDETKNSSIIQFCDYGTIQKNRINDISYPPAKESHEETDQHATVLNTPSLAIKHRLRGVQSYYSEDSQEELAPQGIKYNYFDVDKHFNVRIYSTFDGDCVVADLFDSRTNPRTNLDIACQNLARNPTFLEENSINAKLLKKENHLVYPMEENYSHVLSMKRWIKDFLGSDYTKYSNPTSARSSGPETKDSGHETKSLSQSSFDATSTDNWIELEDMTDSGNESNKTNSSYYGDNLKLNGPNNIYRCRLTGKRVFQRYSEKLGSSSVNAVLCNPKQGRNQNRLIVGSHIELQGSFNRRRITPKQTSLLPDINGIIPLMYLLFAPTVQLIEKKGQNRNGRDLAIVQLKAGLGILKTTEGNETVTTDLNKAIITPDINFSEEDIRTANKIRKMFPRTIEKHEQKANNLNSFISETNNLWAEISKFLTKRRKSK